ncbi:uncharacterized protein LOC143448667 isoform X1 [Clavelina lepadiformis]|uniref:uncharacterized protein LOC143448667 isoform X1 n=1 Tax=Clavelina lepadiformis TaxID=159417 RepID=UPI004041E31E
MNTLYKTLVVFLCVCSAFKLDHALTHLNRRRTVRSEGSQATINYNPCEPIPTICHLQPGNLTTVAKSTFPVNVTTLYMGYNCFEFINVTDFQGFFNLTDLILSSNRISNIDDDSFRDQAQLQNVYLDNNRLSSINSETFAGLTGLQELDMSSNRIDGPLQSGTFQHLISLLHLLLNNNRITELEECIMCNTSSLVTLDLSSNMITTVNKDAFKGLVNLELLHLENNRITTFDFSALVALSKLETITTHNNNWTCTCQLLQEYSLFIMQTGFLINCAENSEQLCVVCSEPQQFNDTKIYALAASNFTDCGGTTTAMATTDTEATLSAATEVTSSANNTNSGEITSETMILSSTTTGVVVTSTPTTPYTLPPEAISNMRTMYLILAIAIPVGVVLVISLVAVIYTTISKSNLKHTHDSSALGNTNGAFTTIPMESTDMNGTSSSTPVNVFETTDTGN